MCRLLTVAAGTPFEPRPLLEAFAELAARSPAPDGDLQDDGWGAAWRDAEGRWMSLHSPRPIWRDADMFSAPPPCRALTLHARSASVPGTETAVSFRQPFLGGAWAFVFNGFLEGVSLPTPADGRGGAAKIWGLLRSLIEAHGPAEGLERTAGLLDRRARRIQALNMAVSDGRRQYAYCRYAENESYYRMWIHESPGRRMIASGPIPGYEFRPIRERRVIAL